MTRSIFIRRAHMYAGLFLAPWVLTFGVSALVIHNQEPLTGWPQRSHVPQAAVAPLRSGVLPAPEMVAMSVVAALNERAGNPGYTLVAGSPAIDGPYSLSLNWDAGGGKAVISADAKDGTITRYKPPSPTERVAAAIPPSVSKEELARLQTAISAAILASDPSIKKVGGLGIPGISFQVAAGGRLYDARCDLVKGDVTLKEHEPTPYWDFLHKLHMTHKYVDGPWYRDVWLIMANLVAATLVFWVLSGIAMWWQMKPARKPGLILLGATVALIVAVYAGMWGSIAS